MRDAWSGCFAEVGWWVKGCRFGGCSLIGKEYPVGAAELMWVRRLEVIGGGM